jgi:hypothetical protein
LAVGTTAELAAGTTAELATGISAELVDGTTAELATGITAELAAGTTAELVAGTTAELAAGRPPRPPVVGSVAISCDEVLQLYNSFRFVLKFCTVMHNLMLFLVLIYKRITIIDKIYPYLKIKLNKFRFMVKNAAVDLVAL